MEKNNESNNDLWGVLPDPEKIKTPLQILKAQADILGEKTQNSLKGVLTSGKVSGELVQATLSMTAPSLGFTREILFIKYGLGIYPVHVIDSYAKKPKRCENEEHFELAIKNVLTSDRVQLLIKQLLTHVNSVKLIKNNTKEPPNLSTQKLKKRDQKKRSKNNY